MIRTQIQLTAQQMKKLRSEAEREQISIAEVIRRSIDASLTRSSTPSLAEIKHRALNCAGRFSSGRADVSANHDHYLEEAFGGRASHK
jgi:hypothetical protein